MEVWSASSGLWRSPQLTPPLPLSTPCGVTVRHHEAQRSSSQLLHMSLWRGDTAAVVRAAAAEALLTDELLALAPMVSYR